MSIVLRILAGLVSAVGVGSLAALGVALRGSGDPGRLLLESGNTLLLVFAVASLIALGGILWSLTRLAFQPPAPQTAAQAPHRSGGRCPRTQFGMASILRILGALQIGIGVLTFGTLYYLLLWPWKPGGPPPNVYWLLMTAAGSWGFACLGGVLLALTRIAYPPTTIASDSRSST
jgi:hypothetical protein